MDAATTTPTTTPDKATLISSFDFIRARTLGTLDTIEKSGQEMARVLAWRPGPGRAHLGWQMMHCAVSLDRYLNVRLKGGEPRNPKLIDAYAGGSTPSDANIPTMAEIRAELANTYGELKNFLAPLGPSDMLKTYKMGNVERTLAESLQLMAWHEAHHQGQIHLTWNLYKAAHGIA